MRVPELLLQPGPAGLTYWQWILLACAIPTALIMARGFTSLLVRVVQRVRRNLAIDVVSAPLRLFLAGLAFQALLPFIELTDKPHLLASEVAKVFMLVASFWVILRVIDVAHEATRKSEWLATRPATAPVLWLGVRVLKVIVMALGVVTTLQQLGYPVAGLIAGLGIGGLAVALAAQKTLENLLGSVMLSIDQPFRVGNMVVLDGTAGIVESIGLRSTRIRTMTKTVVTVPNGKLADMRLEDISAREKTHLGFTVDLSYHTTADDVELVLADIRAMLHAQAGVIVDDTRVHLRELGAEAIVLEANAWFDADVLYAPLRERIALEVMRIMQRRHVRFAQQLTVAKAVVDAVAPFVPQEPRLEPRARG